jgi:hypothetical protein
MVNTPRLLVLRELLPRAAANSLYSIQNLQTLVKLEFWIFQPACPFDISDFLIFVPPALLLSFWVERWYNALSFQGNKNHSQKSAAAGLRDFTAFRPGHMERMRRHEKKDMVARCGDPGRIVSDGFLPAAGSLPTADEQGEQLKL